MSPVFRPLSSTSLAVACAIRDGSVYGFDIMDVTGLPSGTVYPVLGRMSNAEWLGSAWESPNAANSDGRPARRYYRLTEKGTEHLARSIQHYARLAGLPRTEAVPEPGAG
jgi:PadR family transcriptional regulator PadR